MLLSTSIKNTLSMTGMFITGSSNVYLWCLFLDLSYNFGKEHVVKHKQKLLRS